LMIALASRWIETGVVDELEIRKRKDARQRQKLALAALRGCMLTAHPSSYYLWLSLPEFSRAEQVAAALAAQGVMVATADAFNAGTTAPQALRLAIGSVPMDILEQALKKINDTCRL